MELNSVFTNNNSYAFKLNLTNNLKTLNSSFLPI